jgi:hypothetical protein
MIVHVVLIQPREPVQRSAVAGALADLATASKEIPSIRRLRVGRRTRHGLGGYEPAMTRDFAYMALIEFDDRDGLEEYLRHPMHAALGRHFASLGEQSLAYDYEVADVADAAAIDDLIA